MTLSPATFIFTSMHLRSLLLTSLLLGTTALCGKDNEKEAPKPKKAPLPKPDLIALEAAKNIGPLGEWVEPHFPFFSSVLDARELGEGWPKTNLTPRGLILNLGHNTWACFDTDLLRIALIWKGESGQPPVTPEALSSGSYKLAGQKTKDGQDYLVKPIGKPLLANGIYPGWQVGHKPDLTDPRAPSASPEEVGRGPLDPKSGSFKSVRFTPLGVQLEYEVGGCLIKQTIATSNDAENRVRISFALSSHSQVLQLVLGTIAPGWHIVGKEGSTDDFVSHAFPPSDNAVTSELLLSDSSPAARTSPPAQAFLPNWVQPVTTKARLAENKDAYVLDDIPLPLPNEWKRNVRIADITFLDDQGNAAVVTMDGDVWLLSGLKGDLQEVKWKRYASGLHEPMSIVARKGELFVFDRNGIWKLVDTNGDREADLYEMFCNLFSQTAETREFPNSMKLAPDGSLVVSKGGQEGTTYGRDNGKVLRVSPDGKTVTDLAYGLRQPFIGIHPKTGLVTASDQQGNYVPSTPLHIIKNNQFYGHLPTIAPKEQYPAPIADPLTWIPHPVNASAVTQTWLCDAKLGPLNDELIHIGYNRPELLRVLMNTRFTKPQAAVVPFRHDFDFSPLNAAVNPADGQLYITGFQIWGTTAKRISGLVRMRYTGAKRVLLKECTPMDKGVLLRFNEALDPKSATDPDSYSVERWNYRRTFDYGSPHLKLDGTAGQEWMVPSSAYLSKDGKSVFVGLPDMKAVMQMRAGWGLKALDGSPAQNSAYFTPHELATFDPLKEGFQPLTVDLTPRKAVVAAAVAPTVEEGQRLYQMIGCMACHSIDGSAVGKVGPSWKGLFGSVREMAKGAGKVTADEAYIRESIVSPSAKVARGYELFDAGMPIYAGILNDSQIESLVLYIKTLK